MSNQRWYARARINGEWKRIYFTREENGLPRLRAKGNVGITDRAGGVTLRETAARRPDVTGVDFIPRVVNFGVEGVIGPAPRFTWGEVACKGTGYIPAVGTNARRNIVQLARDLNRLRNEVARELKVNPSSVRIRVHSWVRSTQHNANIGGVFNSFHTVRGSKPTCAVDVSVWVGTRRVPNATVIRCANRVSGFANGGIGNYNWGLHFDVRGYRARF